MPSKKVMRQQKTARHGEFDIVEVDVSYSTYDLHNPLHCRRLIYDGLENETPIVLEPGESKSGVVLSDVVAKRLMNKNDDIRVVPGKVSEASDLGDPAAKVARK